MSIVKGYKAPYSIIGVCLNRKEMCALSFECVRSGQERSEVIKKALMYYLSLDDAARDGAIITA